MNFEQILWNKVFCRMFDLVVIEVMTPSGHLSNINEINNWGQSKSLYSSLESNMYLIRKMSKIYLIWLAPSNTTLLNHKQMDLLKKKCEYEFTIFNHNLFYPKQGFWDFEFLDPWHHLWAILTPSFLFRQVATETTSGRVWTLGTR